MARPIDETLVAAHFEALATDLVQRMRREEALTVDAGKSELILFGDLSPPDEPHVLWNHVDEALNQVVHTGAKPESYHLLFLLLNKVFVVVEG